MQYGNDTNHHTQNNMEQVATEQLPRGLVLLLPIVDLVQEGPQNFLNRFVWLGLDVGDQLIVALPLILVKYCLEYKNKRMSTEVQCDNEVSGSVMAK